MEDDEFSDVDLEETINNTNSDFVRQVVPDASVILRDDGSFEHLPSKLYKNGGEYWNRYPKTDYAYSPLSNDYVRIGEYTLMPNMSRRSLDEFKVNGPKHEFNSGSDSLDYVHYNPRQTLPSEERWGFTKRILRLWYIITTIITTTTTTIYQTVTEPFKRKNETFNRGITNFNNHKVQQSESLPRRVFNYFTAIMRNEKTTTSEETTYYNSAKSGPSRIFMNSNNFSANHSTLRKGEVEQKRAWWLFLPLLLPLFGLAYYLLPYQYPLQRESCKYSTAIEQTESCCKNLTALENLVEQLHLKVEQISLALNDTVSKKTDDTLKDTIDLPIKKAVDPPSWETSKKTHHSSARETKECHDLPPCSSYERSQNVGSNLDEEYIRHIVNDAIIKYDADKTGLTDFALGTIGGEVMSTRCTEFYLPNDKKLFGFFSLTPTKNPALNVINRDSSPGQCFGFVGFPGYVVIKTFRPIEVTGFSLEHVSRLVIPKDNEQSAPKKFTVLGLLTVDDKEGFIYGEYIYDIAGPAIQYFAVQNPWMHSVNGKHIPVIHDIVELRINSNHGNPAYTCLYRFRVHGNALMLPADLHDHAGY